MSISVEDLRAIAVRVRADAAAAGELTPTGPVHWDLPESVREAIFEDLASGAYDKAAREATAGDPDMAQD